MLPYEDLEEAINGLPKEKQAPARECLENLRQTARQGAGVAIMSRNFSHGKGAHVKPLK